MKKQPETKTVTKGYVEELYYNNSNRDTAKTLGISEGTLRSLILDLGILQKGKGGGAARDKKIIISD